MSPLTYTKVHILSADPVVNGTMKMEIKHGYEVNSDEWYALYAASWENDDSEEESPYDKMPTVGPVSVLIIPKTRVLCMTRKVDEDFYGSGPESFSSVAFDTKYNVRVLRIELRKSSEGILKVQSIELRRVLKE